MAGIPNSAALAEYSSGVATPSMRL